MAGVSHPSRVRGLKLYLREASVKVQMSHPSRVRGLKHVASQRVENHSGSHPSRVRGLKLDNRNKIKEDF